MPQEKSNSFAAEVKSFRAGIGELMDGFREIFRDGRRIWRSFQADMKKRRTATLAFPSIDDANAFARGVVDRFRGGSISKIEVSKPVYIDRGHRVPDENGTLHPYVYWQPTLMMLDTDGEFFVGRIVVDCVDFELVGLFDDKRFCRVLPNGLLLDPLAKEEFDELMGEIRDISRGLPD